MWILTLDISFRSFAKKTVFLDSGPKFLPRCVNPKKFFYVLQASKVPRRTLKEQHLEKCEKKFKITAPYCTSILLAIERDTLHVHTPGDRKGHTLHVHTPGSIKANTLYTVCPFTWLWKWLHAARPFCWLEKGIHTQGTSKLQVVESDTTLHVYKQLLIVLFLLNI